MLTKPLLEAMKAYREDHVYPLHTPGHKGGRGADEDLKDLLGENALLSDVSLMEELDDIHHPEGAIKDAETLGSDALWGRPLLFWCQWHDGRHPWHAPWRAASWGQDPGSQKQP